MNKIVLSLILFLSLPSYAEGFLSVCQRSPGVRDAMVEKMGKACGSITRENLNNLKKLPILKRNLTQISFSDLQDLENLEGLYLDNNQITHIEPGTFSGLKNLIYLSLTENSISDLQPGVFEGLHLLSSLGLHNNPLNDLNVQVFKDLPSLKTLLMGGTSLRRFPADLCFTRPHFVLIDLSSNPALTKIDDFAFAGCSSELLVIVAGSPLTSTSKAAFHGVAQVDGLPANFDTDAQSDEWGSP